MSERGFFEVLFDDDLPWRRTARASAGGASPGAGDDQRDRLRIAVIVLGRVLEERGLLDVSALDARMKSALYEAEVVAHGVNNPTQMCVACRQPFPPARLNLTDVGPMCDVCLAQR